MTRVKVNSRNQIVIPAETREKLGIKPGDELLLDVAAGAIILVPDPASHTDTLGGLGKEIWAGVDTDEWLQRERDSWERSG